MATKRLIINKWNGGMSNDPNVGQAGSFYDGSGIEIRKDSKKITQSNGFPNNDSPINTRTNGQIIASIFRSTTNNVLASADGYLSNFFQSEQLNGRQYKGEYNGFYNMIEHRGYGVVLANSGTPNDDDILRWTIDGGDAYLGLLDSNIINNPEFDAVGTWSAGTNWSISGGKATHTPGNTAALSQTLTTTNLKRYIVNVSASVTTSTCDVKWDSTTIGTLSSTSTGTVQTFYFDATGASGSLSFVPNTLFDGYIESVTVQESNIEVAVTSLELNEQSVVFASGDFLYIGAGDKIITIDTSTSSWVADTDALTIDNGYTIVGISRIGDQYFVYASDGSSGKQYLWDGITPSFQRVITWYDKPIQRVINFNNIDYIVVKTANRRSLWMVNGYQPELICQSSFIGENNDRFNFNASYVNSYETIGTKFLIPSDTGYIYSYGSLYPGFPKSILREFEFVGGTVSNISYSENVGFNIYLFYSSSKNGTFTNYKTNIYINDESPEYNVRIPGQLISSPVYGTTFSDRGATKKIRIGYSFIDGQKINVYSKVDGGENVVNIYAEDVTTAPSIGATYTYSGKTYTVYAVTRPSNTNAIILHCTYTGTDAITGKLTATLTRTTGTGDSTIVVYKALDKFRLIKTITDKTANKDMFIYNVSFHKIQFALDLMTDNAGETADLYDFILLFDEIDNDL